jgi:hypothetical protein
MRTAPPVYSFISFTSFNYKRATRCSGVPTTGSLYREEEEGCQLLRCLYNILYFLWLHDEFVIILYSISKIAAVKS